MKPSYPGNRPLLCRVIQILMKNSLCLERGQDLVLGVNNENCRVYHSVKPGAASSAIAIMAKAPFPGAVKTRLTPLLTSEEAAELNICFLRDTVATITRLGARAKGIACFTPANAQQYFRDLLPSEFGLLAQRGDDLAARLVSASENLFAFGFKAACFLGSDSPTLPIAILEEALTSLHQPGESIVLGPAEDGGYYLVGLKRPCPALFEGIEWSTDQVCAQTLERAEKLRLRVHLLPCHYDVDDANTLRRLCRELLGPDQSHAESQAPATAHFLRQLTAGKPDILLSC